MREIEISSFYKNSIYLISMLCCLFFQAPGSQEGESVEWRPSTSGVTLNLYEFSNLYQNLSRVEGLVKTFTDAPNKCLGKPGLQLSKPGNPQTRILRVCHNPKQREPLTMVIFESIIKSGGGVNIHVNYAHLLFKINIKRVI